ncbi:MAG: GNAT family N-acetyltransferase [Alphaproteobacteria bacterium]|nr:GNAT family N-acetyltransferase [Alphaproteobacteria bacterium]
MSDFDLRPGQNDDHEDLVNLLACAFGEESDCVFDAPRDFPYLQGVRNYYSGGGGNVLVAENHLGIVGMVSWLPRNIDTNKPDFGLSDGMLLHHLYVHPLLRRERLGMDLMFAAIEAAEAAGCLMIETWMNIKFHRGHKFLRFFTFGASSDARTTEDLQKSTERRYYLDVDDFLDAIENDGEFYDSFFFPPEQPTPDDDHANIDDPSQFVVDDSEPWR